MNILQRWLARLLPEEALYVCRREHGGYVTNRGYAAFYATVFPNLKAVAHRHGWALALHGSLQHDMDLMAMPYEENPSKPADLIHALCDCLGVPDCHVRLDRGKFNGRIIYIIYIANGLYLDISMVNHALGPNDPDEFEE